MSIAEELSQKWGARTGGNSVEFLDRNFRAAVDAALELAAQEAEKVAKQNDADAERRDGINRTTGWPRSPLELEP